MWRDIESEGRRSDLFSDAGDTIEETVKIVRCLRKLPEIYERLKKVEALTSSGEKDSLPRG